jgi:excisionase family DNA binding protein
MIRSEVRHRELSEPVPGKNAEEILTSREARELLKIGRTKLWELTRDCRIPAYRVGEGKTSDLRYKKSEILHWLEANRVHKGVLV